MTNGRTIRRVYCTVSSHPAVVDDDGEELKKAKIRFSQTWFTSREQEHQLLRTMTGQLRLAAWERYAREHPEVLIHIVLKMFKKLEVSFRRYERNDELADSEYVMDWGPCDWNELGEGFVVRFRRADDGPPDWREAAPDEEEPDEDDHGQ
jgi:hypothetical protein